MKFYRCIRHRDALRTAHTYTIEHPAATITIAARAARDLGCWRNTDARRLGETLAAFMAASAHFGGVSPEASKSGCETAEGLAPCGDPAEASLLTVTHETPRKK